MNEHIKSELKRHRLYQWEVANTIGVSEFTLLRWLRVPLSPEKEKRIMDAVAQLTERNESNE